MNTEQVHRLTQYFSPFLIVAGVVLVGYLVRRILFARFSRWAEATDSKVDDIVIAATRGPFIVWWLIFGIYLALGFSVIPANWVGVAQKVLTVLAIASVTVTASHVATGIIKVNADKLHTAVPVTSLTDNITRIIIFSVGILMILNSLGVSIMPVLATLGVGGLAVALALQDTLSNLFAGFHIIFSRQIKVGDFVKLESGEEGYVTDINWRITKIKMLPNNEVLIPNSKLTQSIVVNYYLPDKEIAVLVNVGVDYGSDLEKVERVTADVAGEVMKEVPGGVASFKPFIRYHTFAEFSVNFSVVMRAKEFVDQHLIKHEFVKRLHERYKKEGISIPYPVRDLRCRREDPPPLK